LELAAAKAAGGLACMPGAKVTASTPAGSKMGCTEIYLTISASPALAGVD